MVQAKKLTLSAPFAICYTVVLSVAFAMTVALGILMKHVIGNGDLALGADLKTAHMVSGIIFIVMAIGHGWYNRHWCGRILCSFGLSWKLTAVQKVLPIYIALFLCVAVSAIMILLGNRSIIPFHCGSALLFSVIAIFHITLNIGSKRH